MFYYFVVPLITRLVRTILLLLFSSPSSFPVRMLKALLPTSSPCCSTVVSFGSVLWAMAPSVNPQMDTSSGTFTPTSLQAYSMPEAVSSLMAKKPSGRFLLSGSDGDGAFTGVAQQNHAVVHRNFILLHGIQVAVPAILGNL